MSKMSNFEITLDSFKCDKKLCDSFLIVTIFGEDNELGDKLDLLKSLKNLVGRG
jgi:hypothetical protein